MPKKYLHPRTVRGETKGKTQEMLERGSRKRSFEVLGVRRWRAFVIDREEW